ncbi:putative RNA methyltransferase [Tepiditoga spiralis]|uniref:Putative RNA methyltransferase n=1 Tax=Tepiditoga spiralis TaxID=2108365 RepID=A0A7G1G4Z8_9BACT|nr:23S rRNA (uracil(1939)-C(5))-methyltransferase RlmD [Tepiditoga spiralis]BBE29863.1 putative RNA methyltransferase [Tepiditoga spiralis]
MSLKIEKLVYGGYGFSKDNEKIYLIDDGYPEEVVEVDEIKRKKKTIFAKVNSIKERSPYRINSKCEHFQKCGGCQWLDYDYKHQLTSKTNIVEEQLKRIGKLDIKVNDIIASDFVYNYRAKMEFGFSYNNEVILGLKKKSSNEIVDLKSCPISPKEFDELRNKVKIIVNKLNIQVYNSKNKKGILRSLVLRKNNINNKIMMILVTSKENFNKKEELKNELLKLNISSLIHLVNPNNKVILSGKYNVWYGNEFLEEKFNGIKYKVLPTSFFQNNYNVTQKMLDYVNEYLNTQNTNNKSLLDLYCGVGLFGLYFSKKFKNIKGIEVSKTSINSAKENAKLNNIKNIDFDALDAIKFLKNSKSYDYLIIDPPRAGIGIEGVELISRKIREGVVYISCDPSTFARDLSEFEKLGFKIKSVQPFDMFPNTYHIENISILEKIK